MKPAKPDTTQAVAAAPLDASTRLAYERTFLAYEGTQMAWIRTALSLISFGFTIAKFFELLHNRPGSVEPVVGPQVVGVVMISMGLIALGLGTAQHGVAMRRLHARCPDLPRSVSWVTSLLLTLLGLSALTAALIRS